MFKTEGQPFGDFINVQREYAYMPKLLNSGWIWREYYFRVTRGNAYVPPRYEHEYTETIYLTEDEYLIFKLTFI